MLGLALVNAAKAGATDMEVLKGTIEATALPAGTIDVIPNRVINLSVDEPAGWSPYPSALPRPAARHPSV